MSNDEIFGAVEVILGLAFVAGNISYACISTEHFDPSYLSTVSSSLNFLFSSSTQFMLFYRLLGTRRYIRYISIVVQAYIIIVNIVNKYNMSRDTCSLNRRALARAFGTGARCDAYSNAPRLSKRSDLRPSRSLKSHARKSRFGLAFYLDRVLSRLDKVDDTIDQHHMMSESGQFLLETQ
jgi:hypothetical protein